VETVADGRVLPGRQSWITRDGYYREHRGGRYAGIGAAEYRFGQVGKRERLQALVLQEADVVARLGSLKEEELRLRNAISEAQRLLSGVDAARVLAARAGEFAAARERLLDLRNRRDSLQPKLDQARLVRARLQESFRQCSMTWSPLGREQKELEVALEKKDAEIILRQKEQVGRISSYRQQRGAIPAASRVPEVIARWRDKFGSSGGAKRDIERLQGRLTEQQWETDGTILARRDKLLADLEEARRSVSVRRHHYERAVTATDNARGAYINVLRATVRQYGRNLRSLGELAGVAVETEQPQLENDDVVLAQAGLVVKFDFDEKGPIGLDDGEASGGQQVIKSLILLIGLLMDEGQRGGFVFIDEPFAHLDIFNIERVASFLRATRAQYLLTTPNTHNLGVFEPATLTLVTSKKRPKERWAMPVTFMRRQEAR
jgi:DNA repair exonuclease SbcCD ATPase subunit